MTKGDILNDIIDEVKSAKEQFPDFHSKHEGYAVLLEEVDELWDDIKSNNEEGMYGEAIQVAAMAVRFILDCLS